MKRAVVWELVTAFAFLSLVALHAEGERSDGWATRIVHALLDPDRVPACLGGAALLAVACRWVLWTRADSGGVGMKARARALGGSLVGLATAALMSWFLVEWTVEPHKSWLRPELSQELLRYETLSFALVALGLATAPAGVLAGLAGRPVHAVLVGATLSLGSYCFMSWSCRWEVGWGRAVLLGTGMGLGLALGASRLPASSPGGAAPVVPGRHWLLVPLVASIGWPGRTWLLDRRHQSVLAQLEASDVVVYLSDAWILQTLIVCHLASAWRSRHRAVGEVALSAGVALQLTLLFVRITPAQVLQDVACSALLAIPPSEGFVLTTWGVLTLGALWLRRPREVADVRLL